MYRIPKPGLLAALPAALFALSAAAQTAAGTPAAASSPLPHRLQAMDTNGDGRISEQEFLDAASARFAAMDTAHSGRVDAAAMLASPLAAERLQARADALVRRLDKPGNGYVTQDEVAAAAQKRFAHLDRRGDGKLTPDEFALHRRHGGQDAADTPRAPSAQQRFDRIDANHDGVVTQDEFVAAAVARFQKLDTQGTGRVTAAQIAASPKAQQRATRTVERIVQRLDTNGDGAVTQDEYLAAAKKRFSRMDRNGDGFIDADELPMHRWAHGGRAVKVDG